MPSVAERRRNNVKAGIFVTVAIAAAIVVLAILSDAWTRFTVRTTPYTVRFAVADGIGDLGTGSPVRVGGLKMGRVTAIEGVTGEAFESIDVHFKLDRKAQLYNDARILVSGALIGADGWLDIPNVGSPASGAPTGPISGTSASTLLAKMLGPDGAASTADIIQNTKEFTEFLATVEAEYEQRVVPVLDNARGVTEDARALSTRMREEDWPRWAKRVDDLFGWATDLSEQVDAGVADARVAIADAKAGVSDVRSIIQDAREPIGTAIDNVQVASENVKGSSEDVGVITRRVRNETMDKLDGLLDRGGTAVDEAVAALQTLRADYAGWSEGTDEVIANAALASQQLKLTTIEVRRSPWRLLYQPKQEELEHELLYDATRSFALASADLKAASATLRRVLDDHGDIVAADPEMRQRIEAGILGPLGRYEEAQAQLLDILLRE